MKKIIPYPGAWAFWGYDQFPYILGGQIGMNEVRKEWCNGEQVFIPSYGRFFTPKFCLGPDEGPVLMSLIKDLEAENRKALAEVRDRMNEQRHLTFVGQLDPRKLSI